MSDARIRNLERNAAETGADQDILALRHARMRAGLETMPIASLDAARAQAESNRDALARLERRADALSLESDAADLHDVAMLAEARVDAARDDVSRLAAALDRYPASAGWYLALDPLQTKPLERAAKRAAKRTRAKGAVPVELEMADSLVYLPRQRQDGSEARIALRPVRIIGDIPDAGAWRFIARLHHAPEGTVIHRLRSAAELGDDVLETYRARGAHCDDCIGSGKGVRNWHDTFAILNIETNETAQLGRNCLERYTGASADHAMHVFDTRERLCAMLQEHPELDTSPDAMWGPSLVTFVAHLARRERLGMSALSAAGSSWHDAVLLGLAPQDGTPAVDRYPEAQDIERAMIIVGEARSLLLPALEAERAMHEARERSIPEPEWPEGTPRLAERWHNLSVIIAADAVSIREAQTAARILAWYAQAENERERAIREAQAERLRQDDGQAAAELAESIRGLLDVGVVSCQGGHVSLSVDALASLVLMNGELAPLRELARMIRDGADAFSAPPHDPAGWFAPEGTEGTWLGCRIERMVSYRSGRGCVVKLAHPTATAENGSPLLATVFANGSDADGYAEGDTITLRGTIERHQAGRYGREAIVARGCSLSQE